jgi:hypothetical protein
MKDNPPHKGERGYALRLWQKKFKTKRVLLKTIQNLVSKYRETFEVEADNRRDPPKPPKKSSRRK